MNAIYAVAHTLAAVLLIHSYKRKRQAEEELVTLALVSVIALASFAGLILGINQ